MTDLEMDYWAGVYTACRLTQMGLRFDEFVMSPWEHLNRCGQSSAPACLAMGLLPLLPAQAEVARRLRGFGVVDDYLGGPELRITPRRVRAFAAGRLQDVVWNALPWPVGLAAGALLITVFGAAWLVVRWRRSQTLARPASDRDRR
jgi:hypothetical protein